MATKFEKLKQELKKRNKERGQSPLEEWVLNFFPISHVYDYKLEYQVDYYFIDIAWPHLKFGVELEGKFFHDGYDSSKRDKFLKNRRWEIYKIQSNECWNPKKLAPHLKYIFEKVHPKQKMSYGLAELLDMTDEIIMRSKKEPFAEYCGRCNQIHDISNGCLNITE